MLKRRRLGVDSMENTPENINNTLNTVKARQTGVWSLAAAVCHHIAPAASGESYLGHVNLRNTRRMAASAFSHGQSARV